MESVCQCSTNKRRRQATPPSARVSDDVTSSIIRTVIMVLRTHQNQQSWPQAPPSYSPGVFWSSTPQELCLLGWTPRCLAPPPEEECQPGVVGTVVPLCWRYLRCIQGTLGNVVHSFFLKNQRKCFRSVFKLFRTVCTAQSGILGHVVQ